MSINNIDLNPQMLAGLYAGVLIENESNTIPDKTPVRFLGMNQKHITVVADHPHVPFLPDTELNFLSSILNACKLSLADIAIINFQMAKDKEMDEILDSLSSSKVIFFGIEPSTAGMPINFPPYQVQSFNKRQYLHAPSLSELERDKTSKQKLWTSLKTMFGI